MLVDYYKINHPKGGKYTLPSLNRLLNVSTEWGCEKSDMARVLNRVGLSRVKVEHHQIAWHLKNNGPILSLLIDETGEGHYALISGKKGNTLYFHDSYFGKFYSRSMSFFKKQTKFFNHWLWAIYPKDSTER